MAANPQLRVLYIIWAFLECLLFGGLLYGWGSLSFILKEDGVYSELCYDSVGLLEVPLTNISTTSDVNVVVESSTYAITGNMTASSGHHINNGTGDLTLRKDNPNCSDQDKQLTLVFTIASMMFCAGCALMGLISLKFGTRITRLAALVCFTVGSLLTGFTTHEHPWLIFVGLSLLGVGGIPILMTNTQFGLLFATGSSTVVSMMSGCFDASSGVMLIVKYLHEAGVALRWSMVTISILHLLTLVNTFFFLPRGFISKPVLKFQAEDAVENEVGIELIATTNRDVGLEKDADAEKENLKDGLHEQKKALPPLMSCLKSPIYIFHVFWMAVLQLRFYYFLGSLNTWLNSLLDSKEEVSYFINVLLYAMMCGIFTSPAAGFIYDVNKRIFADSRSQLRRDLMPAVCPLALTSLFGILLSVLVMVEATWVLYAAFILNTIFRSFIYSMGVAYLGVMFPSEYFGTLYGVLIVIGGVVSLAQYGLFNWAEASGFMPVNIFLIIFMATSLIHPAYMWYLSRRAESQVTIEE